MEGLLQDESFAYTGSSLSHTCLLAAHGLKTAHTLPSRGGPSLAASFNQHTFLFTLCACLSMFSCHNLFFFFPSSDHDLPAGIYLTFLYQQSNFKQIQTLLFLIDLPLICRCIWINKLHVYTTLWSKVILIC